MDKKLHPSLLFPSLPFPYKDALGITKNYSYFYSGQALQCSALKLHRTWNWERILEKSEWFSEKPIHNILTIRRIMGFRAKNLEVTLLFVDFFMAFDSIHRGNMEQILLVYGLPKEIITVKMILNRNTKIKVRSPDGDTDFDIVAGVLQGDT